MNSEAFNTEARAALQKGLYYRCEELSRIFEKSSTRDLHGFFPELLGSIFGYGNSADWGLRSSFLKSTDSQVLQQFLSPYGPLFKLIDKLQADGFLRYEFFVQCLPLATQQSLAEGVVTALYHNKIQISGPGKMPAVVSLNAFEYYMFHFAFFMVHQQNTAWDTNGNPSGDSVYTAVFEQYLEYFLPTDGSPVQQLTQSPVTRTATQWPGASSTSLGRNPLGNQFSGLIRIATTTSSHTPHHHHHAGLDHVSLETWRSETFIQILCEFWLNQNTVESVTTNVLSHGQEYFMPSVEHVRVVRMLVKHAHTYVYTNGPDPIHVPLQSLPTVADELKRSIIPQVMQKKLYCFLRHSFAHWPLDPSFRIVLETWLSYIQPWRYMYGSNRLPRNRPGNEPRGPVSWPQWKSFVMDNYLFYTALLLEFTSRATRFDMYSSGDTQLLYRTAKVFAQPSLVDILEEGETLLLLPSGSLKSHYRGSPSGLTTSAVSALRAHILEMEGPAYIYTPVMHKHGNPKIQELHSKVSFTINRIKTGEQGLQLGQSSKSSESMMAWIKSLFDGDFDFKYDRKAEDKKVLSFLEPSLQYLAIVGKLSLDATDAGDGTNTWEPTVSRDGRPTSYVLSPDHASLPECVQTERGLVLTSHGRYQVINGIRRFDVGYAGDPELQPIRSFENAFLVRSFHRVSMYLNRKLERTLEYIYNQPGFVGSVACYMSPALAPSPSQTPLSNSPVTRRQSPQGRIHPRISLRFLASYKVLLYLALIFVFCRLISLNSLLLLAIFCFGLVFMVLLNAQPVYETNERYRKKII